MAFLSNVLKKPKTNIAFQMNRNLQKSNQQNLP